MVAVRSSEILVNFYLPTRRHIGRMNASCLDYSSTLRMEALYSSETFVNMYRITQRRIPENTGRHSHRCEAPSS
jgi:hypothetical protein